MRVAVTITQPRIPPLLCYPRPSDGRGAGGEGNGSGEGWGEGEADDPTAERVPIVASAGEWPEGPNGFEPFIASSLRLCRRSLILGALLAALLTGCTSYGPRFDARTGQPITDPNQKPGEAGKPGEPEFSSVPVTNSIPSEWLKPSTDFFRLGPGDSIQVEILGEAASQSVQSVGPDGKIYYSLLPGLFVWGMSLTEAKTALEDSLAKYMRVKPELALTLTAPQSGKVWILGSVQRSGVYSLATPLSLIEAISLAGGLPSIRASTEEVVDLENSFVMRKGQLVKVSFHNLFRKGDLSQNLFLQPDDFVYLRPASPRQIYVLGAVAQPNMVEYSANTSLLSAIAHVGGPVKYANLSQVAIIRGSLSSPAIAIADYRKILQGQSPDFHLQSGDIVYVPLRTFWKVEVFANQILDQFVRTIAINEGQRAVNPNARPVGISSPFGL